MNKKGECLMNWDDSQLASSAFAKGHGGLSLGQRWGLASILRGGSKQSTHSSAKSAKKSDVGFKSPHSNNYWDIETMLKK